MVTTVDSVPVTKQHATIDVSDRLHNPGGAKGGILGRQCPQSAAPPGAPSEPSGDTAGGSLRILAFRVEVPALISW